MLRLQPFLVTLATWSILEGIALIVLPSEGGDGAGRLGRCGYVDASAGVPVSVLLLLVLLAWWMWFRRHAARQCASAPPAPTSAAPS